MEGRQRERQQYSVPFPFLTLLPGSSAALLDVNTEAANRWPGSTPLRLSPAPPPFPRPVIKPPEVPCSVFRVI